MAASMAGISAARLDARLTRDLNFVALRPLYSALGSERGVLLPPLEEAIARYFQECGVAYQGGQTLLA